MNIDFRKQWQKSIKFRIGSSGLKWTHFLKCLKICISVNTSAQKMQFHKSVSKFIKAKQGHIFIVIITITRKPWQKSFLSNFYDGCAHLPSETDKVQKPCPHQYCHFLANTKVLEILCKANLLINFQKASHLGWRWPTYWAIIHRNLATIWLIACSSSNRQAG